MICVNYCSRNSNYFEWPAPPTLLHQDFCFSGEILAYSMLFSKQLEDFCVIVFLGLFFFLRDFSFQGFICTTSWWSHRDTAEPEPQHLGHLGSEQQLCQVQYFSVCSTQQQLRDIKPSSCLFWQNKSMAMPALSPVVKTSFLPTLCFLPANELIFPPLFLFIC